MRQILKAPDTMKYAILLSLLGLCQVFLAVVNRSVAPVGWLLGWSGLAWVSAGIAYGVNAAWVFGKRPDGGMNGLYVVAFLPFLLVTWLLWHVQKILSRESAHDEIAPGIWLGRRCYGGELPGGIKTVVDLTSEFGEPRGVRRGRRYICVPVLDASAPSLAAFRSLMEAISLAPEPVYIHCAKGHGRSAMVVIAVLMAKGIAPSLAESEKIVRRSPPGIKISNAQRSILKAWSSV